MVAALLTSAPAMAQGSIALRRLIPQESLTRPVHMAELPDGKGTLVVVEQAGRILRFRRDASKAEGVLLDHSKAVSRSGNEEGMLSIAFHPRFAQNHYFYVY
ncbi:MAG TPA: PQQ-dependent sugar dehydrogenase, partial [bacterium]